MQKCMSEMIDADVHFISILSEARRASHKASVKIEDIQAACHGQHCTSSMFD